MGVIQENGFHEILLKQPGRHMLRAHFSMKSWKPEESPELTFNISKYADDVVSRSILLLPKLDVQVDPSQGVDITNTPDQHTRVTAALAPHIERDGALAESGAGRARRSGQDLSRC